MKRRGRELIVKKENVVFSVFVILFACNSLAKSFIPNTFKASFIEERIGVLSKKKNIHSGVIEYKYPAHLRFETQEAVKTILIMGPEKTWHYTAPFIEGEKGELKITATKKKSLGRIFDSMKNGLKSNDHYKVVQKGNSYELLFSKKLEDDVGVKKVTLTFKGKRPIFKLLKQMKIFYGDRSKLYIFDKIESNISLSSKRFSFEPAPNTNVTIL